MELILFFFALIVSFVSVGVIKKINFSQGIKGVDINKKNKPKLSESCGVALLAPLALGFFYLFIVSGEMSLLHLLALVTVFAVIGFYDDIKQKFISKTIAWTYRALIIGIVSLAFAWFYAPSIYWIIPVALFIAGLASLENTFAGLNGWEIGSGFIISCATAFVLWPSDLRLAALVLAGSILGLLLWNKFPAKVFPGDSGTLLIGSALAGLMILTQRIELMLLGLAFFLPHLVDFFLLKLLTNPRDVSQQKALPYKLLEDGRLAIPDYKGRTRYDFAKLLLRLFGPLKEWQLVLIIWLIVALNALLFLFLWGRI